MLAPRRKVESRINRKEILSLLRGKKSQAQTRQTIRDKTKLNSDKDREEENRIPNARDRARKRKGKGIAIKNYGGFSSILESIKRKVKNSDE